MHHHHERKPMGRMMLLGAFASALLGMGSVQAADVETSINESFFPYKDGVPKVDGVDLTVGKTITKDNVDDYKAVLDAATYDLLKKGVHPPITIGPTDSFLVHESYINASRDGFGKTKIDEKGNLQGYIAGRPFLQPPTESDPDQGRKLAYNFRHTFSAGDNVQIKPFFWKYRNAADGNLDRMVEFGFNFLNFKHRVADEPIPEILPNPNNYYRGIYVKAFQPQDVQDTQLLIQLFDEDQRPADAFLYLGYQRRVRRLEASQTTDSFLGSDLMIQDFEGYFGRVAEMTWKYEGTKTLLMPMYRWNEQQRTDPKEFPQKDGYTFIDMWGQGSCFPKITWQVRKVHQIRITPVDKSSPVGYRTMYFDSQTYVTPRTLIYDKAGKLWKSWTIGYTSTEHHLPSNKGKGGAIYDSFGMYDLQNLRCTTGQFRTEISPELTQPRYFSQQFMRSGGY